MFIIQHLSKLHAGISTPALVIDSSQMHKNLETMQNHAVQYNVKLRPHCKTHKSPLLAQKQIDLGAKGISVAKLSEAIVMADSGITDIFIANEITQADKIKKLLKLNNRVHLIIGIDHPDQIKILKKEFSTSENRLSVRIEIDCGFGRCGVLPENPVLIDLARQIKKEPWLELDGLFTHAGQAYLAKSTDEITAIAHHEALQILTAKEILSKNGIEVATISVGSTPTAKEVITIPGITEARPGNYIFHDGIQQALGVCGFEQCSLFVMATVISQPAPDRIVCDAGSKALNLDKGAHSAQLMDQFGTLVNMEGKILRLSEEHGIIYLQQPGQVEIGSPLIIIPNHACVVANLYDTYHLADKDGNVQRIPILARGKSQ